MDTRSTIAVLLPDNTVQQIYCHWAGDFSHNGKILFEHYSDINILKDMMAKGYMSSLGNTIDECEFYDDDNHSIRLECSSEFDCHAYPSLEDYLYNGQKEEYNYIFKNNKWCEITHKVIITKDFLDKTKD